MATQYRLAGNRQWPDIASVLALASQDISEAAAKVGIDAQALLPHLPSYNIFLRGRSVPVLARRYQGTCSVRYFVNTSPTGMIWPFFRFHTFKDGGQTVDFNGWRWLKQNHNCLLRQNQGLAGVIKQSASVNALQQQEQASKAERAATYQAIYAQFHSAKPLPYDNCWLTRRLCGLATPALVNRTAARIKNDLLYLPIESLTNNVIGFHVINMGSSNQKRHYVAFDGAMKGAFVRIKAVTGLKYYPLLFCEGVATALSLALVWPGEIRAVLSCNNFLACRKHIKEQVYFAHDMDIYKPQVGNVGLNKALAAAKRDDYFMTPHFLPLHLTQKPTDFNDMLQLYGVTALQHAMEQVWQPAAMQPGNY